MDYIKVFRTYSTKVFQNKDLVLYKSLIDSRRFEDLYSLVRSECIREKSKQKELTERYKLLVEFEGYVKSYCQLLDIDTEVDDSEQTSMDDLTYEDEEYS